MRRILQNVDLSKLTNDYGQDNEISDGTMGTVRAPIRR